MATRLTAVVLGGATEPSSISSALNIARQIADRLIVVTATGQHADSTKSIDTPVIQSGDQQEESQVTYVPIMKESSGSSLDLREDVQYGIGEALRITPEAERFVVLACNIHPLPGEAGITRLARSKLDYDELNGVLSLSRRYAVHVVEAGSVPSVADARKGGFSVPSIVSRFFRSPVKTIREEKRLVTFLIVGASGAVINELLLFVLRPVLGPIIAQAIGVEVSIVNNFIWNDTFTFGDMSKGAVGRSANKLYRLLKYNALSLGTFALNLAVYSTLIYFGVWYIAASLIAVIVSFIFNYLGSSRWAWKSKAGSPSGARQGAATIQH